MKTIDKLNTLLGQTVRVAHCNNQVIHLEIVGPLVYYPSAAIKWRVRHSESCAIGFNTMDVKLVDTDDTIPTIYIGGSNDDIPKGVSLYSVKLPSGQVVNHVFNESIRYAQTGYTMRYPYGEARKLVRELARMGRPGAELV